MLKHLNIKVNGRVQGVFFRKFTKEQAQKLGLKGTVENLADGSVYIEVEGEQELLDKFIKLCHKGPMMAAVSNVDITESAKIIDFADFIIKK